MSDRNLFVLTRQTPNFKMWVLVLLVVATVTLGDVSEAQYVKEPSSTNISMTSVTSTALAVALAGKKL